MIAIGPSRTVRRVATVDDIDDESLSAAYRASIEAGHVLPIRFVLRQCRSGKIGGGYCSTETARSLFVMAKDTATEAEFVGLADTAEMQIGWDVKWGKLEHLGLYNIGLRGPNDSFIIAPTAALVP